MPVRIVSDGVLTRSVRDSAAFLREAERVYRDLRLAPVGDVRRPGRARRSVAVVTEGIDVSATPEVDALTRGTAELLESLGHRVEWIEQPMPASFKDDFLLYWSSLASVITGTGRMEHGRSWDATRSSTCSPGGSTGTAAATSATCRGATTRLRGPAGSRRSCTVGTTWC